MDKGKMDKNEKGLKITLKCIDGAINFFYAFINGKRVIGGIGSARQQWQGEIPEGEIKLKVRVVGIDNAKYTLSIDLPGTAQDQKLTFSLKGGYHEFELQL